MFGFKFWQICVVLGFSLTQGVLNEFLSSQLDMIVVKISVAYHEVRNVIDASRDLIIDYVDIATYCAFYRKHDKITSFFRLGHDCSIRLWNLDSKTCVQEITSHRKKFDEAIYDVAFHPNRPYIASAGADGLAKVFV